MHKRKHFLQASAVVVAGAMAMGTAAISKTSNVPTVTAAEDTVKILCAGDSITHGYSYSQDGYRKYLCYYLQQNDIAYDMVGPENNWTDSTTYDWDGTTISYDPAHCGYSGYAVKAYNGRSGLYETMFGNGNVMETYDPDIILLQIGTNDLLDARLEAGSGSGDITETTSALERLESLVDEILNNMDSTDTLFVASVPDIDAEVRADWLGNYQWIYGVDTSDTAALAEKVNECVDTYNAGVQNLVAEKQSEGKNVQFGDIHSVVDMKTGLIDGVHPNEVGYASMGKYWATVLNDYLDGNPITTVTTTTTTTTTTVTTGSTDETSGTATTTVTTGSVSDGNDVHLTDVVIGTSYDLTDYSGITGVSFVFAEEEQESVGGKVVFGNWAYTMDYSQSNLVNNTLTVPMEDSYNSMTIYDWNGKGVLKEVILHFDTAEETTTTTTEATTTTTTEETTTATTETTTEATTETTVSSTEESTSETETTTTTTTIEATVTSTEESTSETEATTTTTTTEKTVMGDVDADGEVTLTDLVALQKYLVRKGKIASPQAADLNQDDKINVIDCILLRRILMEQ